MELHSSCSPSVATEAITIEHLTELVTGQIRRIRFPDKPTREDATQAAYLVGLELTDSMRTALPDEVLKRRMRDAALKEVRDARLPFIPVLLDSGAKVPDTGTEDPFQVADVSRAVGDFVSSLTPTQREVVDLVFWRGFKQAEVARDRGIARAAVNQVLSRVYCAGRVALPEYTPRDYAAAA